MNLINKLFVGVLFMVPALISAAEYSWLTFKMDDESELSVVADNLTITYSDGNLLLSSESVNETVPTAQIKSMRFTSAPASVDVIDMGKVIPAEYFTPSGVSVGRFNSIDEAHKALPAGVYIVKSEHKTFKLIL